jgi:hypothetical protein
MRQWILLPARLLVPRPARRWLRRRKQVWIGALTGLAFVVLAGLMFFVFPSLIVTSEEVPHADQRLKLQNDVRTTGIQLLAGAVLALGAVFTARTLHLNREGQITERFTRAIDQLGNDNLDVRIGGIYGLERIARDSERDHAPVMEVLTAFIQERASPRAGDEGEGLRLMRLRSIISRLVGGPAADALNPERSSGGSRADASKADVQAVLTVFGRRKINHEEWFGGPNLSGLDLRELSLRGALLPGVILNGSDLTGADFSIASLQSAELQGANLRGSNLIATHLEWAKLVDADLEGAEIGAFLENADLSGANFKNARFVLPILRNATYDSKTVWPEGFEPGEYGAQMVERRFA